MHCDIHLGKVVFWKVEPLKEEINIFLQYLCQLHDSGYVLTYLLVIRCFGHTRGGAEHDKLRSWGGHAGEKTKNKLPATDPMCPVEALMLLCFP